MHFKLTSCYFPNFKKCSIGDGDGNHHDLFKSDIVHTVKNESLLSFWKIKQMPVSEPALNNTQSSLATPEQFESQLKQNILQGW